MRNMAVLKMLVLFGLLLVVPIACDSLPGAGTGEDADSAEELVEADRDEGESGEDADAKDASGEGADAEADDSLAEGEADDAGNTDGEDAEIDPEIAAQITQTAEAIPTLSQEQAELIQNFQPPSKGDDDAPLVMYEFSDYL